MRLKASEYLTITALFLCANFTTQDSKDLNKICSGTVNYYGQTKTEKITDIKIGATKSSATNGTIKFFIIPPNPTVKTNELVSQSFKLDTIKNIKVLGSPQQETKQVDSRVYIALEVSVFAKNGTLQAITCMMQAETKIFGRRFETGGECEFPLMSVSQLVMDGCIEDPRDIDVAHMKQAAAPEKTIFSVNATTQAA